MILNPVNDAGEPLFFPGAPAPVDPAVACDEWMQSLIGMAALDPGYARWRAGTLGKECPEWYATLLPRLDDYLTSKGIAKPAPFVEPPSRLPVLAKGRRIPKRRLFHDTL